jgi:L,D-transpeptidase YcbB
LGAPLRNAWRKVWWGFAVFLIVAVTPGATRGQEPATDTADTFAAAVRRLIAEDHTPPARGLASARQALLRLYETSEFRPLWVASGRSTAQSNAVLAFLGDIEAHGLRRGDYDIDALPSLTAAAGGVRAANIVLARADVAMSRTLLRVLSDIHSGRVDPGSLGFDLPNAPATIDLPGLVLDVSHASNVPSLIATASPVYPGYAALTGALARYRDLAADPTVLPPARSARAIRPGDEYAGIPALRHLLTALGDLASGTEATPGAGAMDRYAGALVDAVKAFQSRHGLEPDGVIGPATAAELRVPLNDRVHQIELGLERWRWLPDRMPERLVLVNIPEFRLYAFERNVSASMPVFSTKVIVGQAQDRHHTPIFTGTTREVVFRPFWDVPPRIARRELVPRIRREPSYFTREGFEIVRGPEDDAVLYSPTEANLSRVSAGTLRLRQLPGPKNALGFVKLVFPNPYNVYLHGTPEQQLFAQPRRDFSHGCIRVEEPTTLAEFALRGQPAWDRVAIDSASEAEKTTHVGVDEPATVVVFYVTTSVDTAGVVHFYPDIYGHDAVLTKALAMPPAAVASLHLTGGVQSPRQTQGARLDSLRSCENDQH